MILRTMSTERGAFVIHVCGCCGAQTVMDINRAVRFVNRLVTTIKGARTMRQNNLFGRSLCDGLPADPEPPEAA